MATKAPELTVESAQTAVAASQVTLDALHDRLSIGDSSVSGHDLLEAEAQVRADGALLDAAQRAALAVSEAEAEEARLRAIDLLASEYQATADELSKRLAEALKAMDSLASTAAEHAARTRTNALAAGITRLANVPGVGSLAVPTVEEVLAGVHILTTRAVGVDSGNSYPDAALQPVKPFLDRAG